MRTFKSVSLHRETVEAMNTKLDLKEINFSAFVEEAINYFLENGNLEDPILQVKMRK
jgi:Asp-tRNA(Asn)/Glu-tRNA(Gln) amidotransferase B subunit